MKEKKEWNIPQLKIIPFKDTKGGTVVSAEETVFGSNVTIS
jgi:hypothetical protein